MTKPLCKQQYDVLIIGAGAAGLMHALTLKQTLKIAIIAKNSLTESASFYAQGGIAAVLDKGDDFDAHYQDTYNVAQGLGDEKAIRFMVEQAPEMINALSHYGVAFTKKKQNYHLSKEGGHSKRRVVHSDDRTGQTVQNTLIKQIKKQKNITCFQQHIAVELLTEKKQCYGAYIFDKKKQFVQTFIANHTVLATGGGSKAYLYTSNPDTATGDGIAMAYRAGCRIVNMEFTQFHPTCLYHPQAKSFLISEALRGEGAKLTLSDGREFMANYHEKKELAPRDTVARAIDNEMKTGGLDCVYLDISQRSKQWLTNHFPMIFQRCLAFGMDISKTKIPVVPAAHYSCGGIYTNLNGESDIGNLYALGEVAHTGVHGANRLASNSLLECLVFANASAKHINGKKNNKLTTECLFKDWDDSRVTLSKEHVVVSHLWQELRQVMWDFVGIVRSNKRLAYAKKRIRQIQLDINEYYRSYYISTDLIELRNLAQVAILIVQSAQMRKESRGLHFNRDHPKTKTNAENSILQKHS